MDDAIQTRRLILIPLTRDQLEMVMQSEEKFEASLKIRLMRSWITDRVRRAIGMKIEKMGKADATQHHWLTYWLIVIKEENVGAGMLGFKGFPDETGSTEIGYGLTPNIREKGT